MLLLEVSTSVDPLREGCMVLGVLFSNDQFYYVHTMKGRYLGTFSKDRFKVLCGKNDNALVSLEDLLGEL